MVQKIKINPVSTFAPKHPIQGPPPSALSKFASQSALTFPHHPFPGFIRILAILQTPMSLCPLCFCTPGCPGTSLLPQKFLQTCQPICVYTKQSFQLFCQLLIFTYSGQVGEKYSIISFRLIPGGLNCNFLHY